MIYLLLSLGHWTCPVYRMMGCNGLPTFLVSLECETDCNVM